MAKRSIHEDISSLSHCNSRMTRKEIIDLLPHYRDAEIAGKAGCSRQWVFVVRYTSGIPGPRREMSAALKQKIGRIENLAGQGLTVPEITRAMGLKYASEVYTLAKKHGIKFRNISRGPRSFKLQELEKHLAEGGNFASAARLLGVSVSTIIRNAGKYRLRSSKPNLGCIPDAKKRQVRRLLSRYFTIRQIAKRTGLSEYMVGRIKAESAAEEKQKDDKQHASCQSS